MRDATSKAGAPPEAADAAAEKAAEAISERPDAPAATPKHPVGFTVCGQVLTGGGSNTAAVTPPKGHDGNTNPPNSTAKNLDKTLMDTGEEAAEDAYMAVSGGAAVLRNEVFNLIRKGVCPMINAFLSQVELVEKHKRVLKVTAKETSEDKAARVAKALAVERPAMFNV